MKQYQKEFIAFLIKEKSLLFGDFTTKSGRQSPYFINTGNLFRGESIGLLGKYYADHIVNNLKLAPQVIFGPAYKGIPLSVTTAIFLHLDHKIECTYCFDRKEAKDHGDGGSYVGKTPSPGDRVILVEDVVTAGTTIKKMIPILKDELKVELAGVFIAVDRCEVGEGTESAVQESTRTLGISIYPIVTIHQILQYLSSDESGINKLSQENLDKSYQYLEKYGAK